MVSNALRGARSEIQNLQRLKGTLAKDQLNRICLLFLALLLFLIQCERNAPTDGMMSPRSEATYFTPTRPRCSRAETQQQHPGRNARKRGETKGRRIDRESLNERKEERKNTEKVKREKESERLKKGRK